MNTTSETFTKEEEELLKSYVTSLSSNVFVLKNLPEVIKGALFSRYSRSTLGLRSLLLKDFISKEEMLFNEISGKSPEGQTTAIAKAQNFYDRILDGYGDDSIGELGSAHIAFENISMIAAKQIEDARIGGSPLEKSTRYVYFDQKIDDKYSYFREPMIMASAYKDLYLKTCDHLFETYSALIPKLTAVIAKDYPHEAGVSKGAYNAALRAKVLDCLRGLLPASTLTNMGVFGNGRFFETLVQRLGSCQLGEFSDISRDSFDALSEVIPSFVRRSEENHRHNLTFKKFMNNMTEDTADAAAAFKTAETDKTNEPRVRLIRSSSDGPLNVAAALIFPHCNASYSDIKDGLRKRPANEIYALLEKGCIHRENRRHKSPRALEHAEFTFEITADYGIYRDLQRHRMLTQEKQLLTCDLGYYVPEEIKGTEMEAEYTSALDTAAKAFAVIAKDLPEEAQYIVPMAYNIRWYFHINLRALQWLCELRSQPQGHISYRKVAQDLCHSVITKHPEFKQFFKFVDFDGHHLGRLDQEIRNEKKQALKNSV
ncbi:MAG: Flavin-dependent thymidylate synthase [Chlamydiia bacterium]|nr:Flavin-dependent thymidylate synthase [Chlamydiia bacterium]MCH9618301.1 Flavin-dependent thymidylate synthase [Chlamydiia bacterium]MCH9624174.1 Flavin-dependent thymidylate synthase [Chlamydiia bacterium]